MFKGIGKFLAKSVLPLIASNLDLQVKTVEKKDGFYLLILAHVFGFKLLDEQIKFSSQKTASITKNEKLQLEGPIDAIISKSLDQKQKEWAAGAGRDFLQTVQHNYQSN